MVKTNVNKILLIFLLLFMSVSFYACGQVNSSIITYSSGVVEEQVVIVLDIDEVLKQNINIIKLKEEIEADALLEANNFIVKLNNKIDLHLLQDITDETKNVLQNYKNCINVENYGWITENGETSFAIGVQFKNMDIYRYYYNISEDSKVEMQQEKHFFYNKMYWYGNTSYIKHRGLYEGLKFIYETKYPELINHQDAQLTYTYEADFRRLHSDANYIQKANGKYYHTWIVDSDNVNHPVMFYYNVANGENWIVLSLIIALSLTVVMSCVAIGINLYNKNKTIKNRIN